jgi:hypothetical protein
LKNNKISIFGGISKFHLWADFGKFEQFWAVLGRFGQILLHLLFTIADSMPQLGLKF